MKQLLLIALALLLNACSLLPSSQSTENLTLTGSAGDDWQLSGRIAIRQGQHADSANIDWRQSPAHYRIELSGPFGQGGARIEGSPEEVSLQLSGDQQRYQGPTPEAVMQQALGWYLPVRQAHYWVQGRPDPAYPFSALSDTPGFSQLGWQIELRRLTQLPGDIVLPELLELRYDDLRLRLLIRDWQLPNSAAQPDAK